MTNNEMSLMYTKRTLPAIRKIRHTSGRPLPELVEDLTPKNEDYALEHAGQYSGRDPQVYSGACYTMPEFLSSFPVASQVVENDYLNSFHKDLPEYKHLRDVDAWCQDFGLSSGASSWDQSVASFMSWGDEVEGEATEKVKELMEEIDVTLYAERPSSITNTELLQECLDWKEKFPHLRVVGSSVTRIQESPSDNLVGEKDGVEEIIMSHGFIEEPKDCGNDLCDKNEDIYAQSHNLCDKVKKTALEQLSYFILSEILKSCQSYHQVSVQNGQHGVHPQISLSPFPEKTNSFATVLSEDLDGVLTVSRKSIHKVTRKSDSDISLKSPVVREVRAVELSVPPPQRFFSCVSSGRKSSNSSKLSFSILGVSKPLHCDSDIKPIDHRGYHSAADRRKVGILDRRFSCVDTDHERFLKPLGGRPGCGWDSVSGWKGNVNAKEVPTVFSPVKLVRRTTLPPLENADAGRRVGKFAVNSSPETDRRHDTFKKKGVLSPLSNAVNIPEEDVSHLKLAKQLWERSPDKTRWGSGSRRINLASIKEPSRWRKTTARKTNLA